MIEQYSSPNSSIRKWFSFCVLSIVSSVLLCQTVPDKTSEQKIEYYAGIVAQHKGACNDANALFQSFINTYNGSDKSYWINRAESHLTQCEEIPTTTNETISYWHRPTILGIINVSQNDYDPQTSKGPIDDRKPPNDIAQDTELATNPSDHDDTDSDSQANHGKDGPMNDMAEDTELATKPSGTDNTDTEPQSAKGPDDERDLPTDIMDDTELITGEDKPTSNDDSASRKGVNMDHHYRVLFAITDNADETFISLMDIGPVYSEKIPKSSYYQYFLGQTSSVDTAKKIRQKIEGRGYQYLKILEYDEGEIVGEVK